jgi:3,4-dihydroxy-2-butanone 4-phosphate synthase
VSAVRLEPQAPPRLAADAVERAVEDLVAGRMVVVRDDEDRGGEGDVLLAAEFASADAVNFMARHARGIVCLALSGERCDELALEPIGRRGHSLLGDASMVSIEARSGVSTGISAADRARTIQVAVDPDAGPEDLVRPGHVFPLRARPGGVLERRGRTEAAVELARLGGLRPAGVLCEIMRDDGHMARGEDLERFAAEHGLSVVAVSDLLAHRLGIEPALAGAASPAGAKHEMRTAMGHFATGVTVVTARRLDGSPVGTTVNAVSSVSLRPPLLLACLATDSETLAALRDSSRFAVNMLAAEQRHHSDRFAAKGDGARPDEVEFEEHALGVPVLPGSLATIACRVEAIHRAGDHEIVIGEALSISPASNGARPLLFFRGSYLDKP